MKKFWKGLLIFCGMYFLSTMMSLFTMYLCTWTLNPNEWDEGGQLGMTCLILLSLTVSAIVTVIQMDIRLEND